MSGSGGRGIGAAGLLLDGFAGYLRSERGVTELTVDVYVGDIRRFLVDRGGGGLSELTAAEVFALATVWGVSVPLLPPKFGSPE